jgi:transposase-like protein
MEKRFCPKCKSTNVERIIDATLAIGAPQKWKCNNCEFHNVEFLIKEKLNKNIKRKN